MKVEPKKCKECGKLFIPTFPQQKYCTEDHYRPCPVCGKPVFAKYLSDPSRCCSGTCRAKLGKINKENKDKIIGYVEADVRATQELYEAMNSEPSDQIDSNPDDYEPEVLHKYVGENGKDGFLTNHRYEIEIISEGKGQHIVHGTFDFENDCFVDLKTTFTNKKHIAKEFKLSK